MCKCLENMDAEREMAEIRVDLLSDPENLKQCFSKANELKIRTIATVRDAQGFTSARKARVLECLDAACTFVDIEVEAPKEYQQFLVQEAKKRGVVVIISHHNYEEVEASSLGLDLVIKDCFDKGADLAKVAVAVCSTQGAARVLAVYGQYDNVVSIGMGAFGKVTRVACLALGSPFSFASWDESSATAPGQLTRAQMLQGVELIASSPSSSVKRVKLE